jgi:hypothetical protein
MPCAFLILFSFSAQGRESYFENENSKKFLTFGIAAGLGKVEQTGLNYSIQISRDLSGANTPKMQQATEYAFYAMYHFSNSPFAIQLRPTIFKQKSSGQGPAGQYNYELKGQTFFPLIRWTALQSKFIDFYLQFGAGMGSLNGSIINDNREVTFKGKSYGSQAGAGLNMYFGSTNSIGLEANYRYLPLQRNIITKMTGAPNGVNPSTPGHELENDQSNNITTYLSGLIGYATYNISF